MTKLDIQNECWTQAELLIERHRLDARFLEEIADQFWFIAEKALELAGATEPN
jgi:hypothetical protein